DGLDGDPVHVLVLLVFELDRLAQQFGQPDQPLGGEQGGGVQLAVAVIPEGIAGVLSQLGGEATSVDVALGGHPVVVEDAAVLELADQPVAAGAQQAGGLWQGVGLHAAASSSPFRASSIHCWAVCITSRRLVRGMLMLCMLLRWRSVRLTAFGSWETDSWTVSSVRQGRTVPVRTSRCTKVPSRRSWVASSSTPCWVSWSLMPHLRRTGRSRSVQRTAGVTVGGWQPCGCRRSRRSARCGP